MARVADVLNGNARWAAERSDVIAWLRGLPDDSLDLVVICRHCLRKKVNRPRGLCWSCYYTPGLKERYPSTSKYARRGVGGGFNSNAPLPAPTAAKPGSPEKVAVLEARAAAGEQMHHPEDAT